MGKRARPGAIAGQSSVGPAPSPGKAAIVGRLTGEGAGSTDDISPERIGQVLGLIALTLLPLASGGYSGWGYELGLVLLPLAAALCLWRLRISALAALTLLVILLTPVLWLSPLWAHWTHTGRLLWHTLLAIPCAWVVARSLLDSPRRAWLMPAVAGGALLSALWGWFLLYGHWLNHGDLDMQLSSSFGLHNAYAGYLLLAWPTAAVAALETRSKWGRWGWWLLTPVLIATLVATHSRAASLVVFGQLFISFCCLIWKAGYTKYGHNSVNVFNKTVYLLGSISWRLAVLSLAIISSVGLVLAAVLFRILGGETSFGEYSMQGRLRFWEAALAMFRDHPLTGVGPGAFGYVYSQYQRDWMFYSVDPHSWVLQLLAECGLVGAVAVAAILVGVMVWAVRAVGVKRGVAQPSAAVQDSVSPAAQPSQPGTAVPPLLAILLILAVLGSLAHAAFDFDYTFTATTALLGVLLAYGSWLAERGRRPAGPAMPRTIIWPVVVLCVFIVTGQAYTLERFTLDQLDPSLSMDSRAKLLRQAVRYAPDDELAHLQLAGLLAQTEGKSSPEALDHAQRANWNQSNAAAWALLGGLAATPEESSADLQKAIALDPYNHPEYYYAWAMATSDAQERYRRLKLGVTRIPAEHPITPDHVRGPDWYRLNPLWAKWWHLLADLEPDKAAAKLDEAHAQEFREYVGKQQPSQ